MSSNPTVLAEIEQGVVDCYAYIDALIETRRTAPGENLITDLIQAEEAGDKLNQVILVSSWHANRDGVEHPDAFDVTALRDGARVLTFGAGIHYCVGANLARAEIQEGLIHLAENVERIKPDGKPEFSTPSGIYGLDRLPLVFER